MRLAEVLQFVPAFVPVNMATAANTGDWVSMKNFKHVAIVLVKGAGANGEPPTITVQQAKDASGGSAKALNFTDVYVKSNADITTVDKFTKTTQASGNTYAPAAGDTQMVAVIEFDAQDLDTENGFSFVQASIADVGSTSQIGTILYVLGAGRYVGEPLVGAIA